jgi:hypothetical protein
MPTQKAASPALETVELLVDEVREYSDRFNKLRASWDGCVEEPDRISTSSLISTWNCLR